MSLAAALTDHAIALGRAATARAGAGSGGGTAAGLGAGLGGSLLGAVGLAVQQQQLRSSCSFCFSPSSMFPAHAARRPRDLPSQGHVQSLRRLHVGGLGLVHQRELVELLDVEQRLEQPRLEDPNNPHDGGAQLPLVLLGVEACEV